MKKYKIKQPLPQFGDNTARVIEVPDELVKEIRADVIDDFVHKCDKRCGFYTGENKILTREDILIIAEQLKAGDKK